MPRLAAPVFLMLASLCAGCAVGPDYQPPATALPQAYMGGRVLGEGKPPSPDSSTDLTAWWAAFGDAQMARLVTAALQQNLDVAQAAGRVLQALSLIHI